MILKNFNIYFFMLILIIGTIAGFLLVKPYLSPIFIAALIAVIFFRPYEFIKEKVHSPAISSALMLFIVAIVIILPIIFVLGLVYNEVSGFVVESAQETSTVQESVERIAEMIDNVPILNVSLERLETHVTGPELSNSVKNAANYSVGLIQSVYRGVVGSVVGVFVMFFTLFYFFIDGKRIIKKIMGLSPMRDVHERLLIDEFISMTRATLKGTVVIGLLQGVLGGVAFAIAGIVSPILWTVIMIVLAIIPAVGAGLVIFPAAIIMLILGHVWQAIFLFIVGFFVSTIDNFLRPKLVGNDTQMHSLAVFFATIGGLKMFGIIGFIVGPIVMALMLAMWKIYAIEFKSQLQKFNA
jgi:predicted PurR-regulated permease PerM